MMIVNHVKKYLIIILICILELLQMYAQAWTCWVLKYFYVIFEMNLHTLSLLYVPRYIVINSAGGFSCFHIFSSIYCL